jgi:hypothetical protein
MYFFERRPNPRACTEQPDVVQMFTSYYIAQISASVEVSPGLELRTRCNSEPKAVECEFMPHLSAN